HPHVCLLFVLSPLCFCFFFFTAPASTEIYTLSLHDALPIYQRFRAGLTGLCFPIHRERLLRKKCFKKQTDSHCHRPGGPPYGYPTPGNCSNLPPHRRRVNGFPRGDEDTSSSPCPSAHQAAVGRVALRSDASRSPVWPARAARPPTIHT